MVSIKTSNSFLYFFLLLLCQQASGQWSISGQVVDASSGEGLSYVNILIGKEGKGTTTDQKGNFLIDGLTAEKYGVTFSMIGFQTIQIESLTRESVPLFINLQPEIYLANEVVVSASRKTQSLSLAPASVGIITRENLQQASTRSFDDAFHSINGIQVTRSSGSNVQALSIRGASEIAGGGIGNRVLLLLDGRPAITPESGGAIWNLVPLGAIERIEVIKGAYSSLFGSSAMGGVINVVTRVPDSIPQTEFHIGYGFYNKAPQYAEYNFFKDYYNADVTHSGQKGNWSYLVNGAGKRNAGHREKSSFTTYNAFGKLKFEFSPNRSLQVSGMYSDIFNDTPATWLSTTKAYSVAAHRKDDTQHRREWNADLHYVAFAHAHIKYSTRFYYYSNLSDFVFNDDTDNDSTNVNFGKQFIDEERVVVSRLGNATQVDFSLGNDHYLLGGVELQSDFVDGRPDTVLYGRHKAWNMGAFIQDQISLGDHVIVTAGIRYDRYMISGTFSEANISPKVAAVFQPSKKISFRTLLARAYRNPSIAERYTKFEQGGGLSFKPNPLLRAEKLTLSAEMGAKIGIGKKIKFDGAVFYNHYRDLISYQQRSVPGEAFLFEVINLNKAIMQGFEIGVDYAPMKWLTIQSGYTYLDARDASEGRLNDVLPYKSKHTTYLTLMADRRDLHFYFQVRSRSRIDEVFIYPGSEPDGYVILNTSLSYAFNPGFSVSGSVNNLTNTYYEEIERYRMEGRSFSIGLHWRL